jgi:hypothetical protein
MSEDKIGRDNLSFLLQHIRVHRINIETVPSKAMFAVGLRKELGDAYNDSWQDIVIKVEDRAGNEFEVERIPCQYDGMISSSTPSARLVNERSWRDEEGEGLTCAVCFFPGHGAGACDRLEDNELPWPKPISHYDSDGPRDGGPIVFQIAGVEFLVDGTDVIAANTGRTRYKVVCRKCDEILHKATTGASSYIESHMKAAHDFHRKLTHVEAP